ncbi:MAG: general secretion pathway protein GspB [Zoogloeaceae bacterium]|jgi:hypothetical protein|nr:general secretion pathway protein GspB [Zoogloeaceae bacterium]
MKNAALLISCLAILLSIMTGFLLLERTPGRAPISAGMRQPAPNTDAQELEKTRVTLRRFEKDEEDASVVLQTRRIDTREWLFPLPKVAAAEPVQISTAVPALSGAHADEASGNNRPLSPGIDPQLSFIFFSQDFRRAIIDGYFVREGDLLSDGARLVAIRDTSVVVRKGRKRQRIEIPAVFPQPPARIP